MSSDDDRDVMISVRGLGKAYTIAHAANKPTTLAEATLARLRRPLHRPARETFWALKDVSFDVRRGDVVGVIGRNGAGKSTLFKVLSRITEPTAGEVELYGRVGSLLEVGTGFSGELSGRENIYLNGTILGMAREEIARQFDGIVAFSGVEQFLDTPVKRYSSGMYVRLAFAVAAHLDSDILIVDEVLAVGDAQFQQKCLGKLREVSTQEGRTVLLVSHNLPTIMDLCPQCIYLERGRLVQAGPTDVVIGEYMSRGNAASSGEVTYPIHKPVQVAACRVMNADRAVSRTISVSSSILIGVTIACESAVANVEVSVRVHNAIGVPIFTSNLSQARRSLSNLAPGRHAFEVEIPAMFLAPGIYNFVVGVHTPNVEAYDEVSDNLQFAVEELGSSMALYGGKSYGSVLVNFDWRETTANGI